ncbi:MAG: hypothetical protein V9H25_07375 [Candidatus Competibacter sp.]
MTLARRCRTAATVAVSMAQPSTALVDRGRGRGDRPVAPMTAIRWLQRPTGRPHSRHPLAPIGRDIPPIAAHHQIRQQAGPAGLMGGTQTLSGVAVEVLVELQQVAPVRIVLERAVGRECREASFGVATVDAHQSLGDQGRDFLQSQFPVAQSWARRR